jgi:hypothetical protein
MADTKISALTNIASGLLAAGDKFPVADASDLTASYHATAANIKTFVNTAPVYAAGSASASTWPTFTSGTLLTTAEDGAIELDADCFYGCTDAGNRGVIPIRHFIRCDSTRTLGNVGTEQAIFNSPTNGRITLETGCYLFEGMLYITSMSGTGGNAAIDPLGAGTATCGSWLYHACGIDATNPTTAATQTGTFSITQQTAASAVTAGTGTSVAIELRGTFEVTGAGTMIPGITLVTSIATAVVAIGSYMMFERIGSTSVVSVGQWD